MVGAQAALLVARLLGRATPRGPSIRRVDTVLAGGPGRLWLPPAPAPGILLVAGVTPAGVRDERLDRAAQAVAAAGRTVFAPQLALSERRLTDRDVECVRASALGLAEHPHVRGPVVGVGFSFGGSVLLLAAADPEVAAGVAAVATFGAYADLEGYLQALATGQSIVGGRRDPWPAHSDRMAEFRDAVVGLLRDRAADLLDDEQRARLAAALQGRAEADDLVPVARSVYDALVHDDPRRTAALVADLPQPLLDAIRRFSPIRSAPQLSVPIMALHSTDDVVVPPAELDRLAAAYPHARLYRVASMAHVDLSRSPGRAMDGVRAAATLLRFATDVLRAGDPLRRRWAA